MEKDQEFWFVWVKVAMPVRWLSEVSGFAHRSKVVLVVTFHRTRALT